MENRPLLRFHIFELFRYQHQRKLLWLSALGQRHTIERLLGFLRLLVEEYRKLTPKGYCLSYPLTHAQIGSAIGSTRVTVTRLIQQGLILTSEENMICLACDAFSGSYPQTRVYWAD